LQFGLSRLHGASTCAKDVGNRYQEVYKKNLSQSNQNMQSQKCKVYSSIVHCPIKEVSVNWIARLIQLIVFVISSRMVIEKLFSLIPLIMLSIQISQ